MCPIHNSFLLYFFYIYNYYNTITHYPSVHSAFFVVFISCRYSLICIIECFFFVCGEGSSRVVTQGERKSGRNLSSDILYKRWLRVTIFGYVINIVKSFGYK